MAPITQELLGQFNELLITFTVVDAEFKKVTDDKFKNGQFQDSEFATPAVIQEFIKEEMRRETYYKERKDHLEIVLKILSGLDLDFQVVYSALAEAKRKKILDAANGKTIDARRNFVEERDLVLKRFKEAWEQLKKFLVNTDHPVKIIDCKRPPEKFIRRPLTPTIHLLDFILTSVLENEPLLNYEPPTQRRRPHAGHQPEPWLKEVKKRLGEAGVPKEQREELLEAVGLVT